MHTKSLQSCLTLCDLWTVAHQAPPSMGLSRQEYWSGLPRPPPGDLPNPGIEPKSLRSPALAGRFFTLAPPGKPHICSYVHNKRAVHRGYLWEGMLQMRGSKSLLLLHTLLYTLHFFKKLFPIWRLNLHFLHCRQILYYLSHQGIPF